MAANVVIRANVVDISVDTPRENEIFFVDTNVWYWTTYSKASLYSLSNPYQTSNYPAYVNRALNIGAKLKYSGLNILELTHVIERSECEISGTGANFKEFRHNYAAQRAAVCAEINSCFLQVKSIGNYFDVDLSETEISHVISRFNNFEVDGYDCMIAANLLRKGVDKIVTDDGDFASVPGVTVFTANRNIIYRARQAGKLIVR